MFVLSRSGVVKAAAVEGGKKRKKRHIVNAKGTER